jgi:hypothetical protein
MQEVTGNDTEDACHYLDLVIRKLADIRGTRESHRLARLAVPTKDDPIFQGKCTRLLADLSDLRDSKTAAEDFADSASGTVRSIMESDSPTMKQRTAIANIASGVKKWNR